MSENNDTIDEQQAMLNVHNKDILDQFETWIEQCTVHINNNKIITKIITTTEQEKINGIKPLLAVPQTGYFKYVEYHKFSKSSD